MIYAKVSITKEPDAGKFDPQPFHIDDNAAKESIFGGLVASSQNIEPVIEYGYRYIIACKNSV